jgi:hypothetical protein
MNDAVIVPIFVVIDDVLRALGHRTDPRARTSDSEVLTVATVAACPFQNPQERALCVMRGMGYLSGPLSVSPFNRRAHALADWFALLLDVLGEVFATGTAVVLDSMPLPACRRARAARCRKVQGDESYGYCAAKAERFYGWRLHLVCTPAGIPVAFDLLPASLHDLTPVHELVERVPGGAWLYGDKAYNSAAAEAMIAGETGCGWCRSAGRTWHRTRSTSGRDCGGIARGSRASTASWRHGASSGCTPGHTRGSCSRCSLPCSRSCA